MTNATEGMDQGRNATVRSAPKRPHTIYLHYFTYSGGSISSTKTYKYIDEQNPIPNMRQQIERVIRNVITGTPNNNLKFLGNGTNFDRTHKGYVVVALEDAQFKLLSSSNPTSYVTFTCTEADVPTSETHNDGKHTFQFRGHYDETISNKAVSYVSYLYSAKSYDHGDDLLDDEWERFKIEFVAMIGEKRTIEVPYEDSGGTNMGPPARPPGFFGPLIWLKGKISRFF